jgi:hypothetical protein
VKLLILLLGAGLAGYFIYQNAKVDPQVTRLDGWESTAKNRRPNMPSPAVGEDTPLYAESERAK